MSASKKVAPVAVDGGEKEKPAQAPAPVPAPPRTRGRRHRDTELLRTIGERLRTARELSCFSQSDAARLLGYQNPSKLSKIEKLMNSKNVPLAVLKRAADVYQVSIDYLMGRTDDWGTPGIVRGRETAAWLFDEWEKARHRDMETLQKLNCRLNTIDGSIESCVDQAFALSDALQWFVAHNRKRFAEMPGGARLIASADKLVKAAQESRADIRRFKMECRTARQPDKAQKDLFEEDEDDSPLKP